jgi:hypothetical protein
MSDYTPETVLNKVRQLFPADAQPADVTALLEEYGIAPHERERERVQLAILMLSGGDPDLLLQGVLAAKADYRDVLAWAEFPKQARLATEAPADERQRAIAEDAAHYRRWRER